MSISHSHSDSTDSSTSQPSKASETSDTSKVTTPTPSPENSTLDDIFGDGNSSSIYHTSSILPPSTQISHSTQSPHATLPQEHHPSDEARLRSIHVTAGYRDGIAQARSAAVQGGFDEGWILGAAIGVRVGMLLGVVEGVVAALQQGFGDLRSRVEDGRDGAASSSQGFTVEKLASAQERARALLTCMRRDLQAQHVFGEQFVNLDGTWKWLVSTEEMENGGMDCVAEAHPLIRKYAAAVARWVRALGLRREGNGLDDGGHD